MTYYWLEWFGTWGLWVKDEGQFQRCLFRVRMDEHGWWRVDQVFTAVVEDRKFIARYKDVERAKARCLIELRFPEGETK